MEVLLMLCLACIAYRLTMLSLRHVAEQAQSILNLCIGPFVCVGMFVPNIDLGRVKGLVPSRHSFKRAILGVLLSMILYRYMLIHAAAWWIKLPVLLYMARSFIKMRYPDGFFLKSGIRVFGRTKTTHIGSTSGVVVKNNQIVPQHSVAEAMRSSKKVMIHVLGSADNLSTYISRVWGAKQFIGGPDVCNICIEQPGIQSNALYRRYSLFAHALNLFLMTLPYWVMTVGVKPVLFLVLFICPLFYDAFSISSYAKRIQSVVRAVKAEGKADCDISICAYSLGGVSALMWRKIFDVSASIRVILDRSPYVTKIHNYGSKRFVLPAVGLYASTFISVYSLLGASYSLILVASLSFTPVLTLLLFKHIRAGVLKFCLKLIGNWTELPDMSNLIACNVSSDQILGNEFLFKPLGKPSFESKTTAGDHISVPIFAKDGRSIERYEACDDKMQSMVNCYERIISKVVTRHPSRPRLPV